MINFTNIPTFTPPLPFQTERGAYNYMSTPTIYGLIRQLVEFTGGPYLEIGSYRGMSLLAAGQDNGIECTGIDNFTEVGHRSENEPILLEQIAPFSNIALIKSDYEKALKKLHRDKEKYGVVFVDGPHSADDTEKQIKLSAKMLKKDGFIIVDDLNYTPVALGLDRFLKTAAGKKYEVVFDQLTNSRHHPVWWNGLAVLQKK